MENFKFSSNSLPNEKQIQNNSHLSLNNISFLESCKNQIYIKRDKERCCECCFITKRKFYISNSDNLEGLTILGLDESCLFTYYFLSSIRKLTLLFGGPMNSTLRFEKDWTCGSCCFGSLMQIFMGSDYIGKVMAPCNAGGNPRIIKAHQFCLFCYCCSQVPTMDIFDERGKKLYRISYECPSCTLFCTNGLCRCWKKMDFYIFVEGDPEPKGRLHKKLSFCSINGYDNFTINLPPNIKVEHKILIIAAAILIDYLYFEDVNFCTKPK